MLHKLETAPGARKAPKRKGRGPGSRWGKTAGRGQKGQYARNTVARGFEGGQTPLRRKLPRRGFNNVFKKVFLVVNVGELSKRKSLADRTEIDPAVLEETGVVSKKGMKIKVLGDGEVTRALTVKAHQFSKTAIEKLKAAGGEAVVIEA